MRSHFKISDRNLINHHINDFSRAERGKFYREDVIFKVPIYLADEVVEFFAKRAEAKGVELSELLNDVLRQDIALLEKMQ